MYASDQGDTREYYQANDAFRESNIVLAKLENLQL